MSQTYTKARAFRKKDSKKKLAANKAYSIPTTMSSCLDIRGVFQKYAERFHRMFVIGSNVDDISHQACLVYVNQI